MGLAAVATYAGGAPHMPRRSSPWELNTVDDVGKTVWFQIPIPSEILPTFEQGMKYMMATKKFVSDPSGCTSSVAQLLIGKSLVFVCKVYMSLFLKLLFM